MLKKSISILTISLLIGSTFLTGCTSEADSISNAQELYSYEGSKLVTTNTYSLPIGSYDSADTAILQSIDTKAKTVTLYNTIAAKTYTLKYDGTTYVSDKYGTAMAMEQLSEGLIVNVNFLKTTKQLVDIQISPEAWSYDNVNKYNLAGINSTATIGDRTYALPKGVQVFSQGESAKIENIVPGDLLTVAGIGYDIYSIRVENGHGYVRLTNDEALVGGWVEIGSELITQITDTNMLLAVPEGNYTVRMYNYKDSILQDISVDRNQEVILDCSDIKVPEVNYGQIRFIISPDNAVLKLDGVVQDTSRIIKTSYGIHEIEVTASGYDTLNKYINVGEELADIVLNLDETIAYVSTNGIENTSIGTTEPDPISGTTSSTTINTTGTGTTSDNATNNTDTNDKGGVTSAITYVTEDEAVIIDPQDGGNRVYIELSEGEELYYDGVKIESPKSGINKVAGNHAITIISSNGKFKTYTIYLEDDGEDVSISFPKSE